MTDNRIGHFKVGALMVADDLLLNSSNTSELQIAIALAEKDASRERYKFNADKTKIVAVKTPQDTRFMLYNKQLGYSKAEPHLGISRNQQNNNKDTIIKRIQKARRTTYSLLGAGLSGIENIGPEVAIRGFNIYILPILLHGLETLMLTKSEMNELELFQREMLRRFMKLPESTAIPAIHLLSGTLPIEAEIHKRSLGLLRSVLDANPDCPPAVFMKAFMVRQLAMEESNSWATKMRSLLKQYQLPPANTLIQHPPKKQQWKDALKGVNKFWFEKLKKEAHSMSTLSLLDIEQCTSGTIHPIWRNLYNTNDVKKAVIKARLLVQRYPLATSYTAGRKKDDICPLCKADRETVTHFLLHCEATNILRQPLMREILHICKRYRVSIEHEYLTKVLLDSNCIKFKHNLEEVSRNLVWILHRHRSVRTHPKTAKITRKTVPQPQS